MWLQFVRQSLICLCFWLWLGLTTAVMPGKSTATLFAQEKTAAHAPADSAQQSLMWQPSPTGAMVRSIIFPGWGQWYNHKKLKALLVFATESGIITTAVYWQRQSKRAPTHGEHDFDLDNRNLAFWYLGGAILLSMADAYIDAQLAGFDVSPDLSWQHGQPAFGFTLRCRF